MRTTIEISNETRARLLALAARRGLRGYSELVAEAIEAYLREAEEGEQDLQEVLALRGSMTDEEAADLERVVAEARGAWRS